MLVREVLSLMLGNNAVGDSETVVETNVRDVGATEVVTGELKQLCADR